MTCNLTGNDMATRDEMFPSKYLTASDLKGKPITVAIASADSEVLTSRDGKEERKTVLAFKGAKKTLPLNLTNWLSVADITGEDDSDKWPGHAVELYPTTTELKGKPVACVRIRAPAQRELPKPPAPKPAVADDVDDEVPF
jgi:hypothetical protein